ncbi:hypothetical protein [Tardiphaga sp.]|uniref:hypothetical protein n=1 Tax=Tardiphaga sp. TaxID=1926292 RepID=UPI0026160B3B|nr:hypothetical protein [Tardiphaga sp.]MDB5619220.1 hypothetical protein [Tardiphaga sp.]
MLPGFRFLIAAVLLGFSMLVFGFGATALLRSAREEFANLPVRRSAPQMVFASQQPPEAPATLSMLRVEAPETRTAAPADIAVALPASPAPTEPEADRQASLSLAAPTTDVPPVAEPARPEPAQVETVPAVEIAAAPAAVPPPAAAESRADEPATVAAIAAPATTPDQPASTLTPADAQIMSFTVATLGGPPVDIEPVPLPKAKPVVTTEKKVRMKGKSAKRRRLDARAELPPAQPAATPAFGWSQQQ